MGRCAQNISRGSVCGPDLLEAGPPSSSTAFIVPWCGVTEVQAQTGNGDPASSPLHCLASSRISIHGCQGSSCSPEVGAGKRRRAPNPPGDSKWSARPIFCSLRDNKSEDNRAIIVLCFLTKFNRLHLIRQRFGGAQNEEFSVRIKCKRMIVLCKHESSQQSEGRRRLLAS